MERLLTRLELPPLDTILNIIASEESLGRLGRSWNFFSIEKAAEVSLRPLDLRMLSCRLKRLGHLD
jgi:hypothetical protein